MRGRGIGRALLDEIVDLVDEQGALTLLLGTSDEANLTNLAGRDLFRDPLAISQSIEAARAHPLGFWLKVGFAVVGVVPDAEGRRDRQADDPAREAGRAETIAVAGTAPRQSGGARVDGGQPRCEAGLLGTDHAQTVAWHSTRAQSLTPYGTRPILPRDVPTVVEGDFEWDSGKAASNLEKHGVSFFEPRPCSLTRSRFISTTAPEEGSWS